MIYVLIVDFARGEPYNIMVSGSIEDLAECANNFDISECYGLTVEVWQDSTMIDSRSFSQSEVGMVLDYLREVTK